MLRSVTKLRTLDFAGGPPPHNSDGRMQLNGQVAIASREPRALVRQGEPSDGTTTCTRASSTPLPQRGLASNQRSPEGDLSIIRWDLDAPLREGGIDIPLPSLKLGALRTRGRGNSGVRSLEDVWLTRVRGHDRHRRAGAPKPPLWGAVLGEGPPMFPRINDAEGPSALWEG